MKINFSDLLKLKQKHGYKSLAKCLYKLRGTKDLMSDIDLFITHSIYNLLPNAEFDSNGYCILGIDDKYIATCNYYDENFLSKAADIELLHLLSELKQSNRAQFNLLITQNKIFKQLLRKKYIPGDYPNTLKLLDDSYSRLFAKFKPELVYPKSVLVMNKDIYNILHKYPSINVRLTYVDYKYITLDEFKSRQDHNTIDLWRLWASSDKSVIRYALATLDEELISKTINSCSEISDNAYIHVYNYIDFANLPHDKLKLFNRYNIYHSLQMTYGVFPGYSNIFKSFGSATALIGKFSKRSLQKELLSSILNYIKFLFSHGAISWYLVQKAVKHCERSQFSIMDDDLKRMLIQPLIVRWNDDNKKREYANKVSEIVDDINDHIIILLCDKQKEHNLEYIHMLATRINPNTLTNHNCRKHNCKLNTIYQRNIKRAIH